MQFSACELHKMHELLGGALRSLWVFCSCSVLLSTCFRIHGTNAATADTDA